uniref:EXTRA-LARGE G-protein n=1 Tax=Rhizophora mucronata TaxID=61149 RepID=A0A2P2NCW8_RHIMU
MTKRYPIYIDILGRQLICLRQHLSLDYLSNLQIIQQSLEHS